MRDSVLDKLISVPPEWAPQKAIWTAWPANAEEWNGDLASPRRDVAGLVVRSASPTVFVCSSRAPRPRPRPASRLAARPSSFPPATAISGSAIPGPIFARTADGAIALRFRTNGWGGKFDLPDDATVGDEIARLAGTPVRTFDFVLEGGAVEHDGDGTILATRETLLNANRNGWTEAQAEAALGEAFGARKIVWLDRGLRNDHTDGHVDVLARFAGPARVVCQSPSGADDPNAEILDEIACALEGATDATGRRFDVVRIPSPGLVLNDHGEAGTGLASELRHRQWARRRARLRNSFGLARGRSFAGGVPWP